MDPQEVGALLATLNQMRQQGATIGQINSFLREDGNPFTYDQLVDQAKSSLEAPPQAPGPVTTEQILTAEGQGATFSFLDEIMGAMAAPVGAPGAQAAAVRGDFEAGDPNVDPGARSEQVREDVRETTEEFREERPVGSFASELLGGLAVPALGTGAAVLRGKSFLPRMGRAMAAGTIGGGLAGAGEAEEPGDIPESMFGGAIAGGLTATGFAATGGAVGAVALPVWRHIEGLFVPGRVGRYAMAQAIREAGEKAGITGDDFRAAFDELQQVRPGLGVPADVARTLRSLLTESVTTARGAIGDDVSRLRARPAGAPERLGRDLQRFSDWEGLANHTSKTVAGEVNARMPQGGRAAAAFERGQEAYRTSLAGPRVDAEIATITREAGDRASEVLEAYRFGLVAEMYQDIISTPRGANVGRQFSMGAEAGMSPARQTLIRQAFPNERAYRNFVRGAEAEDMFARLQNLHEGGLPSTGAGGGEGSRIFRAARMASVWGARASAFNFLAGQNAAAQRARVRFLVEMLSTPGDVNAMKMQQILNSGEFSLSALGAAGGAVAAVAGDIVGTSRIGDIRDLDFSNSGLNAILSQQENQ